MLIFGDVAVPMKNIVSIKKTKTRILGGEKEELRHTIKVDFLSAGSEVISESIHYEDEHSRDEDFLDYVKMYRRTTH